MTDNTAQTVSVIIPLRNEAASVPGLLQSLAAQDYPRLDQVLLVDGQSEDGTREVIAAYCQRDARFRLVDNPAKVVTHALNLGLAEATGEVIVRLDAHAEYAPDYVSSCLEVLHETGAGNVGGPAVAASDGSYLGDVIQAVHQSSFGIGAAKFRQEDAEGWVDTVWPGAYRREALEAAGRYYVEELTRSEDIELNSRLRKAGWGVYLSPKIRARYYPRKSLQALLRQNFANGAAVVQTLRARRGGVSLRHLVPLLFVSSLALGALATALWRPACWPLLGLLALYGAADLAFCVAAARRHGPRVLLLLPVAFLLLHLAYGLGSLSGLFVAPRRVGPEA